MNNELRKEVEGELVRVVEDKFPNVREIWYNPTHLDPDGGEMKQECYFFINGKYDFALSDLFSDIEIRMFQEHDWNLSFLQLPSAPECERLVYRRKQ